MPKVERSVIEEHLSNVLQQVKSNRKLVVNIKKELLEHGIKFGESQSIITGKTALSDTSLTVICLLMLTLSKYGNDIYPENYFTEQEIKNAKTFEIIQEPSIELPYTFENVTYVKDGNFSTIITAKQIKELFDSNILVYNFDTQREAKVERGKDDEIILKPKTNPKSVKEIADLLLASELETSTITFNARVGTGEDGNELIYDTKNRTLTVTKGTLLDILDGYHRISGINMAMSKDPELQGVFDLKILNYSKARALKYFFQINKTNPISEARRKEANVANMTTATIEELRAKCSFLQGKISNSDKPFTGSDQLVSYNVLSDAIDEFYSPKNKLEAIQLSDYLTSFFDTLMVNYPEAFITNIKEVRKHSLINANQMFYGYIFISKYLKDNNHPVSMVKDIINNIDFSRDNKQWIEAGVINESGRITTNPKRKIKAIFNEATANEVFTHGV